MQRRRRAGILVAFAGLFLLAGLVSLWLARDVDLHRRAQAHWLESEGIPALVAAQHLRIGFERLRLEIQSLVVARYTAFEASQSLFEDLLETARSEAVMKTEGGKDLPRALTAYYDVARQVATSTAQDDVLTEGWVLTEERLPTEPTLVDLAQKDRQVELALDQLAQRAEDRVHQAQAQGMMPIPWTPALVCLALALILCCVAALELWLEPSRVRDTAGPPLPPPPDGAAPLEP